MIGDKDDLNFATQGSFESVIRIRDIFSNYLSAIWHLFAPIPN